MTTVHTYFYIVVDTQRGCHTLKLSPIKFRILGLVTDFIKTPVKNYTWLLVLC